MTRLDARWFSSGWLRGRSSDRRELLARTSDGLRMKELAGNWETFELGEAVGMKKKGPVSGPHTRVPNQRSPRQ